MECGRSLILLVAGVGLLLFLSCVDSIAVNYRHYKVTRPTRYAQYHAGPKQDSGVQIISKNTWQEMGMKPIPSAFYRRKANKKVDTQKFRQCIFFQLCPKSDCFHFGRHGKCS